MENTLQVASLQELEKKIEKGIQTWVEVSYCLMEIRDRRLYKEKGYESFSDYCWEVWGWKRSYVYDQIQSAKSMEVLSKGSAEADNLPQNERHARELTPLVKADEQEALETWHNLKTTHGDKITGPIIREAVQEKLKTIDIEKPKPREVKPVEWTEPEKERYFQVKDGKTVICNIYKEPALVEWARNEGLFVRIDRAAVWGNPFEIPGDGTREVVCSSYEIYYNLKKSLHPRVGELKGKVLGCHCYPEQCHGDYLKEVAENEG